MKALYSGIEFGIGQMGQIDLADFDEDETGKFPLIYPFFALTLGVAFL